MLVRKRVVFLLCILTLITGNIISKVTFQDENVTNMIQNATECVDEVQEIAPSQPPPPNHTINGNGGEDLGCFSGTVRTITVLNFYFTVVSN